ncbi:putative SNAP protein [Trypanosoma grayi]|uniref:putative SNAP protein n=1 Tax=Trypanosoma grayi TaxID=71804 RepID=UPI0004F45748|nr:putative SNAP protein [Trypanosoma grayi]KEG10595.1 putative SNAP protein [Trypanosoma grayi]
MEKRGDQLMEEGEKSLSKFSLFNFSSDKSEKARDKFTQAATQYKACGEFAKAGHAYKRAADMSQKSNNEWDVATDLEEAARSYVKCGDTSKAVQMYAQVAELHEKAQRYSKAAKTCISLGEIAHEKEAMQWLEKAARFYELQGSRVTADEVVLKMADVKARCGDYDGAREVYDRLARAALDDRVSRGGARKLFFTALLAELATFTSDSIQEDVAVLQERFDEYQGLDTQFNELTREHMLIRAVIEAIQEESVEKMDEAVSEYDNICPLDEMRGKMLLRAKTALRQCVENLR